MKTTVAAKTLQQANLTPQLIQSIRLLQLNALELEQELRMALERNPLLEIEEQADEQENEEESAAQEAAAEDRSVADYGESAAVVEISDTSLDFDGTEICYRSNDGDEYDSAGQYAHSDDRDVRLTVLRQLLIVLREPVHAKIAEWLVDQVDENGFLEVALDALLAEGGSVFSVSTAEIEYVRQAMLRQEPAGFGAASLSECLRVQLETHDAPGYLKHLAMLVVTHHLNVLATHDYAALADALKVDAGTARHAAELVLSLDPRPGMAKAEERHIIPEVVAKRGVEGWSVELCSWGSPKVKIDTSVERQLIRAGDGAGVRGLRDLLSEAKWLVRGLAMRRETLLKVSSVIVERQNAFLERGAEAMKPLTLREVAEAIGMHESTVSRVTTGKYIQTPRGTYELKFFFSVHLAGTNLAGPAVRAMVKRLIDAENVEAPLADDQIATILARQGVRIARRTVAKYREQMNIPTAKERRQSRIKAA